MRAAKFMALIFGKYSDIPTRILVVGGGGAGANYGGSAVRPGGGAGGVQEIQTYIGLPGQSYAVVVGAGGLAGGDGNAFGDGGANGFASSFGALLTSLPGCAPGTSTAITSGPGKTASGCGVEVGAAVPGRIGTPGQGHDGGIPNGVTNFAGGGGGAGSAAIESSPGSGLQNDISGSLVIYGQGGRPDTAFAGAAGPGWGGNGFGPGPPNVAQRGGNGIVVIRYPGGTRATGGTITHSAGDTIHTFTANGTLTYI